MIKSLLEVHGKPVDEILEATLGGVMRQGGFAYNSQDGCVYRDDETGFKCAVGQLVTDELFDPQYNSGTNVGAFAYVLRTRGFDVQLSEAELQLLAAAQVYHDDASGRLLPGDAPVAALNIAKIMREAINPSAHFINTCSTEDLVIVEEWLDRKIKQLEAA